MKYLLSQIQLKISGSWSRLIFWLTEIPHRFRKTAEHFKEGAEHFPKLTRQSKPRLRVIARSVFKWWAILVILLLEFCGIAEIYETITDWLKFNTRGLHDWEIEVAKSVYGDSINYSLVRMDERAFVGPKTHRFAYVSFHTINSWGPMTNGLLIHELMHVWQYERIGAMYIPLALRAQHTTVGYNYGGVSYLKHNGHKGLWDFNLEQQADLVADYYLIQAGYNPQWGIGQKKDVAVYEPFIRELQKS